MLNDMESAMAFIEKQDAEIISGVKDDWHSALEEALKILSSPGKLMVEYNPAIWRISRQPAGIRLVSSPWDTYFIFEFATPNLMLPFDCFPSMEAKTGVMVHELAHLIDDRRWGFDLRGLALDSREYVTREQRAELLAFAGYPLGIFEANRALIESTLRKLGYGAYELREYLLPLAAVETLGRIGMKRSDDLVRFYADVEAHFPVHLLLENYLATNVFSLAGLTTSPDLNKSRAYGIKRSRDLGSARVKLCEYLRGETGINDLEEKLNELGYRVNAQNYNPLSCMDFTHLNFDAAEKNIALAMDAFEGERYFNDLRDALREIAAQLKKHEKL